MKTTLFTLDHCIERPDQFEHQVAKYLVPTLPAYAIEYAELKAYPDLDGGRNEFLQGRGFEIKKNIVIWNSFIANISRRDELPILIIHYHGIRDFRLLFPAIHAEHRVNRLSSYYEEAEKSFDSGAWLSFMLMAGAIFEGLLLDRIGSASVNTFSKLTGKAKLAGFISQQESEIFERVRSYRNLVHLNRDEGNYVCRSEVMDTRKALDAIVIRFSISENNMV